MFAKLIATVLGWTASKAGTAAGKVAATLIPYQVYLTPALAFLVCSVAFYLTNQASKLNLALVALIAVNEAILAAQIAAKATPSTPAKS